jgi:hypothetical protein
MANTYTQIYIHVVFAIEGRQNLIQPARNDELQKYITGIITEYVELLEKFGVEYDRRYIFNPGGE